MSNDHVNVYQTKIAMMVVVFSVLELTVLLPVNLDLFQVTIVLFILATMPFLYFSAVRLLFITFVVVIPSTRLLTIVLPRFPRLIFHSLTFLCAQLRAPAPYFPLLALVLGIFTPFCLPFLQRDREIFTAFTGFFDIIDPFFYPYFCTVIDLFDDFLTGSLEYRILSFSNYLQLRLIFIIRESFQFHFERIRALKSRLFLEIKLIFN